MYSAVLMLALTAGAETVDFGNRGGCTGNCGGVVVGGCNGTVVSGCSGTVVNGCTGSHGGCRGIFGGHGRRGGCTGVVYCGCNGTVVNGGCTGVVYSGCNGTVVNGCYGCNGCNGCNGGHGLFGRRNRGGCCGTVVTYSSCYGCVGGCGGVIVTPSTTTPAAKPMAKPPENIETPKKKGSEVSAPATILVTLPVGARLTFDGAPTSNSSAATRSFITPALQVGANYGYVLRAEIVNNGQTVSQTQQVNVRGGETSTVRFEFPSTGVAAR